MWLCFYICSAKRLLLDSLYVYLFWFANQKKSTHLAPAHVSGPLDVRHDLQGDLVALAAVAAAVAADLDEVPEGDENFVLRQEKKMFSTFQLLQ